MGHSQGLPEGEERKTPLMTVNQLDRAGAPPKETPAVFIHTSLLGTQASQGEQVIL